MLANLRALFGVFVDIMFLRRGPEQLPPSRELLVILVALHVVAYSLAYHAFLAPLLGVSGVSIWIGYLFIAVLMMAWFRVALQLAGKPERFVQTMIAVFFVSLLGVALFPLVATLLPYTFGPKPPPENPPPVALSLLGDAFSFWLLAMLTRIVKSAFEWSWPGAIGFVVLSVIGVPFFLMLILGGGAGAGAG